MIFTLNRIKKNIYKRKIKILVLDIFLFVLLYYVFIIPLRIHFGIPIEGLNIGGINHGFIIKDVTNIEEKLFLIRQFDISLDNEFAVFDNEIRVGVNGHLKKELHLSFVGNEYEYHYGFVTFCGTFNDENGKFEFLKHIGITDEDIEEHEKNEKYIYNIGKSYVLCYNDDSNRFIFHVAQTLKDEWQHKNINVGQTMESLKNQDTSLGYLWTINEVISRDLIWKDLLLFIISFIIIVFVDFLIIGFKINKNDK